MLTQEQNDTLCQVTRSTPMGNLMRRYWIPFLLDWELPGPDCPPVEVRLLGEDLVAFKDTSGRVGLIQSACPHRRVSLFWGRNENDGIRCVYHGWQFNVDGNCIDMPSEPEATNFKSKVQITAYPCVERGGVIWAYMGPPDKKPAEPGFEWTGVSPMHRSVTKVQQQCNWLQALEGGIDSVHTNFLHRNLQGDRRDVMQRARETSLAAQVEVVPTDYGYSYAGIRTVGEEGDYVRGYHWVMPWHQLRPFQASSRVPRVNGHMWVPIDDQNTLVFNWTYTWGEEPLNEAERAQRGSGNELYVDIDVENGFRPTRNNGNKYLIDRQIQKTVNFSGIMGTNVQDRAVQESMGPICDRTLERLGTTDRAIITARRQLLRAVKTVQEGGDPPGVAPTYYKVRAVETVLPRGTHWFEAMRPVLFQEAQPKEPAAVAAR